MKNGRILPWQTNPIWKLYYTSSKIYFDNIFSSEQEILPDTIFKEIN